ncbi:hypothetical protein AB0K02_30340 [Streptomyces sp. NPDC049597]|uniref:hypothetical protein n=1 Tax=Streptomyces sp. NPDC049597 TaxID=3155276 RepID=UPI00341D13D9
MTDHRETYENDQTADGRLTRQRVLMNALDAVLDVEAGLREVLLQSRPAAVIDDLDAVLDVEAGLREVLPTAPPAPKVQPQLRTAEAGSPSAEQLFPSVSNQARLQLRAHPAVTRAYRTFERAISLAHALGFELDRARAFVSALDLARALARALSVDSDLGLARDRSLSRDLVRALGLARRLVPGRPRSLALDLDRARDLALRVHRDLDLGLARGLARAGALDRARAFDLALALDSTHTVALAGAREPTPVPALDTARATADDLVSTRAEEVKQAIDSALGQALPGLDVDLVDGFLNDFTTSDLRNADLGGIDLVGVRWSMSGTQWPNDVDIEDLKTRSEETPVGSGIWTVRSGTATVGDLATYQ